MAATVNYYPPAPGAGDVTGLTSADGSVTIGSPTGPIPDLSVAIPTESTTTLIAQATEIAVSSLAGDTDGNYEIRGNLICTVNNAGKITIKPNDLATNQAGRGVYFSSVAPGGTSETVFRVCEPGAANATIRFVAFLSSAQGQNRLFTCSAFFVSSGPQSEWFNGWWTATSTAITSIVVESTVANAFEAGSYLTVRKLKEST